MPVSSLALRHEQTDVDYDRKRRLERLFVPSSRFFDEPLYPFLHVFKFCLKKQIPNIYFIYLKYNGFFIWGQYGNRKIREDARIFGACEDLSLIPSTTIKDTQ